MSYDTYAPLQRALDVLRKVRAGVVDVAEIDACVAAIDLAAQTNICRRCGGQMRPGQAMAQTMQCSDEGTSSPGGPGRLVDCMKCELCGWSVRERARVTATPD